MSHLLIVGGSDARIMAAYGQEIACRIDTEVSKRVEIFANQSSMTC